MCGEKLVTEFITRYMMGSPLRVRGKVGPVIQLRAGPGITPAYAGKSRRCRPATLIRRDHPCVCGEKILTRASRRGKKGSPPRVRGKAVHHKHRHSPGRITPACAGKRCRSPAFRSMPWDHPRMCGEKKKAEEMGATTKGSPPRMRGKAFRVGLAGRILGITPACAGKRSIFGITFSNCGDHPRVCGEKAANLRAV